MNFLRNSVSDILLDLTEDKARLLYTVNTKYKLLLTLFKLNLISREEIQEVYNTLVTSGYHVDSPW